MIRLSNVKIRANLDDRQVIDLALKKYNIKPHEIKSAYIFKRSIDARNKKDIYYNYAVDVDMKVSRIIKGATVVEEDEYPDINILRKSKSKIAVVGSGPAGLFCALTLVDNGFCPVVFERGADVEKRVEIVDNFINNGTLNTTTNIQFGEGGAGTFSDGKLNTGNTSIFSRKVLEEFVRFGAPREILYVAKPHIGTDNLVKIVKNMREYIISKGGEFRFETQVTDLVINKGKLVGIKCGEEEIKTDTVVLAIGHSARDTFKMILDKNIQIVPKNFAIGARIEHLQKDINFAQYGDECEFELPPAEYKLVYHAKNGRVCYTFCMCPGGQVMASSSDVDTVVTNGMSRFARDGKNANSALLVEVRPEDCGGSSPLSGMYFQEALEKKAFLMGGLNYYAPAQKVGDYLEGVTTTSFEKVEPTYKPGVMPSNLNELFPGFVNETLKEAIVELDKKMHGFADKDAVLTAVETRTSSPVQITRDKNSLMSNVYGIYPCGEGAGYAGGIMTAAVDGIKVAIKILEKE